MSNSSIATSLADPTSVWWIKAADFYMGALGFAVTIITLIVATSARRAARDAKLRVEKYDVLSASNSTKLALADLIQVSPLASWESILICLSDVREFLIDAEHAIGNIDDKLSSRLRASSASTQKLIFLIDAAQVGKKPYPDADDLKKSLRKLNDNISAAQKKLQDQLT